MRRVFPHLASGRFRTVALEQSIKEQGAACQRDMLSKKSHILSVASMSRLRTPSRGDRTPDLFVAEEGQKTCRAEYDESLGEARKPYG